MKQKVFFSVFFSVLFTLFLGSFFHLVNLPWIFTGFGLILGMLFWSVSNGPKLFWERYRWQIIFTCVLLSVIFAFTHNIFMSLSFLILMTGIIYTFWDLDYYKNKVVSFNTWGYCLYGCFSLVYFMGFSVAANIVGSNTALDLNCDDIYQYYSNFSSTFSKGNSKPLMTKVKLNWSDRIENRLREELHDSPALTQLYGKIKGYKEDIAMSITDQTQINREICDLVTKRIHEVYTSSNVKIGLVLLLGLFLYPFFALLLYTYGIVMYLLFLLAIRYGLFVKVKKTIEVEHLE